jgi:hypothetical protein
LEPAHPIAVALAASLEAIDALFRAKRRSPGIVPDEAKPALTDCASRDPVSPVTFQAVRHCSLPWSARPSHACRLRRSLPAPQLSAGRRRTSQGGTAPIRRLRALGRGPKVASDDPGFRFVQPKSRSEVMAVTLRRCHRDKPKFTGLPHCTGGMLDPDQPIPRGATALLSCPHDGSCE